VIKLFADARFKETDLFRLFQTGDIANIDGVTDEEKRSLQHIVTLRK
jgi:hypothetical protein